MPNVGSRYLCIVNADIENEFDGEVLSVMRCLINIASPALVSDIRPSFPPSMV